MGVGKAGTGKTYALDAARDAWLSAGIPVTGVAQAARAALELQDVRDPLYHPRPRAGPP